MPKVEFIDKFLARIEKVDRASVENYIRSLVGGRDFFWAVIDSLEEGVLAVDPDGKILLVNRAARSILGLSQSLQVDERPLREIVRDNELVELIEESLKHGDEFVKRETDLLEPREMSLTVCISPLLDTDRKPMGSLVCLSNLTGRMEQEREAVRKEKIESLTTLAAGIAHEIGNPLNSVGIQLKLLQRETDKVTQASRREKLLDLLGVMQSEVSRLDRIVRNFLQATRRRMTQFRKENINDVLEEAVKVLEPEMRKGRIQLVMKLNRRIPEFLLDPEKMHQAFVNIVKNAIQSMGAGGTLSVHSDLRGKVCEIRFKDEGVGIPKNALPHIFEAYYTTKEEGSGLGLVTVHNAVKEHGGRVDVKSKIDEGTEFTLFLPLRREKLPLPGAAPEKGILRPGEAKG